VSSSLLSRWLRSGGSGTSLGSRRAMEIPALPLLRLDWLLAPYSRTGPTFSSTDRATVLGSTIRPGGTSPCRPFVRRRRGCRLREAGVFLKKHRLADGL
jgi:hypothetical protein